MSSFYKFIWYNRKIILKLVSAVQYCYTYAIFLLYLWNRGSSIPGITIRYNTKWVPSNVLYTLLIHFISSYSI